MTSRGDDDMGQEPLELNGRKAGNEMSTKNKRFVLSQQCAVEKILKKVSYMDLVRGLSNKTSESIESSLSLLNFDSNNSNSNSSNRFE